MGRRLLLGGLAIGAFILTLIVFSWHEGLWQSAAAPVANRAPPAHAAAPAAQADPVPAAAAAPTALNPAAPAPAAAAPPAAPEADAEDPLGRRDRARHGARSR